MNVEIRAKAALFPEKEYINGIAVAVRRLCQNAQRVRTVRNTRAALCAMSSGTAAANQRQTV